MLNPQMLFVIVGKSISHRMLATFMSYECRSGTRINAPVLEPTFTSGRGRAMSLLCCLRLRMVELSSWVAVHWFLQEVSCCRCRLSIASYRLCSHDSLPRPSFLCPILTVKCNVLLVMVGACTLLDCRMMTVQILSLLPPYQISQ